MSLFPPVLEDHHLLTLSNQTVIRSLSDTFLSLSFNPKTSYPTLTSSERFRDQPRHTLTPLHPQIKEDTPYNYNLPYITSLGSAHTHTFFFPLSHIPALFLPSLITHSPRSLKMASMASFFNNRNFRLTYSSQQLPTDDDGRTYLEETWNREDGAVAKLYTLVPAAPMYHTIDNDEIVDSAPTGVPSTPPYDGPEEPVEPASAAPAQEPPSDDELPEYDDVNVVETITDMLVNQLYPAHNDSVEEANNAQRAAQRVQEQLGSYLRAHGLREHLSRELSSRLQDQIEAAVATSIATVTARNTYVPSHLRDRGAAAASRTPGPAWGTHIEDSPVQDSDQDELERFGDGH